MVKVSIVRAEKPDVRRALELISFSPGQYDLVAIKPNLCCTRPHYTGATTDPRLVEEVIKVFRDHAEEMAVIESDGFSATAEEAAEGTGIAEVCSYFEIPFVNLSRDLRIPVKGEFKALHNARMPRTLLKADLLVNLPVMKTHMLSTVSLGLKNLFGVLPERKSTYHSRLSEAICDVAKIRRPELTIMDGMIGMEGEGPISGRPKKMGLLLASEDVVALDVTACMVMRINPVYVDHIQKAAYYGLGVANPARIQVMGERVEDVWDRFMT